MPAYAPYAKFGKTKMIPLNVYLNGKRVESNVYQVEFWIEVPEDWYALGSSGFKDKLVRVVKREDWLAADCI